MEGHMKVQPRAQLVPGNNSHSPSDPAHANDTCSLFYSPRGTFQYQGAWVTPGFFRGGESKCQYVQKQASCGRPSDERSLADS